jgi:hypothetical protein
MVKRGKNGFREAGSCDRLPGSVEAFPRLLLVEGGQPVSVGLYKLIHHFNDVVKR